MKWIFDEREMAPDFQVFCYVDSPSSQWFIWEKISFKAGAGILAKNCDLWRHKLRNAGPNQIYFQDLLAADQTYERASCLR